MSIRDIMLTMLSYPEPTPLSSIKAAGQLARQHGARLSGALCVPQLPAISNFLADKLVGANEAIAEENRKSERQAQALTAELARVAGTESADIRRIETGNVVDPRPVAEHARLFDLALLPIHGHPEANLIAETLIFSSGRPVMLLPPVDDLAEISKVVIGWDGSRPAARATGDSIPFLKRAERVEVVTITGEKPLSDGLTLDAVRRHLERHEIEATSLEVPADGADAGTALLRHCEQGGAKLLVMGAYGQSRIREFVLGGATRTIFADARLPVLLSH